MAKPPTMIT